MFDINRFEKEIEEIVKIDSGTKNYAGVMQINQWFAERFEKAGFEVTWLDHTDGSESKSLLIHKGEIKELEILYLCHTDTVFQVGDQEKNPFRKTDDNKLMGLGVADMKAGCLYGLYLAEQLMEEGADCSKIAFLYNGQEETGSVGSREAIEKYCKRAKKVIALEPARANGDCLKQRKGISRYKIKFYGKAAHSGVNPQDGESAIKEMCQWILHLEKYTNIESGLTVNCGIVSGGSAANSVPDYAEVIIDVRSQEYFDAQDFDEIVRDMPNKKFNPNIRVEIEGGITRPPMKPNEKTEEFCASITEEAKKLGLDIKWASSGGGSDACFSSGLGVLSIDAVGPMGGKFHTFEEFLDLKEIDTRFELMKIVALKLIK